MDVPLRMAAMLVSALLALAACATVPAHGKISLEQPAVSQRVRVVVHGSTLGYTNQELTQLVSSCLAHTPLPDHVAKGEAETRFHFETSFMGSRPVEDVKVTLLMHGTWIASRWTRTFSPDQEPAGEFCREMAGLVLELLPSMA